MWFWYDIAGFSSFTFCSCCTLIALLCQHIIICIYLQLWHMALVWQILAGFQALCYDLREKKCCKLWWLNLYIVKGRMIGTFERYMTRINYYVENLFFNLISSLGHYSLIITFPKVTKSSVKSWVLMQIVGFTGV